MPLILVAGGHVTSVMRLLWPTICLRCCIREGCEFGVLPLTCVGALVERRKKGKTVSDVEVFWHVIAVE